MSTSNPPAEAHPQLQFDMSTSPPSSPPLQHVPPIPLQSPPLQPQLERPRTPPPIYSPRPAPSHLQVYTSPSRHVSPIEPTSPIQHASPRERLTRFAPTPTALSPHAPSSQQSSLLPSAEAPASIFPTTLPPRPNPPSHTSYFGFYALPRPHISARPSTPRREAVQLRSLSGQHRTQDSTGDERDFGAEESGLDRSRMRYGGNENERMGCLRWVRKRHIGLVLGVVGVVVLFWVLIGLGMRMKKEREGGVETKVVA